MKIIKLECGRCKSPLHGRHKPNQRWVGTELTCGEATCVSLAAKRQRAGAA